MANTELDKTIEELEAEVMAELEEANGADAPKKGAAKAEPQLKASDASSVTPGGEVQDMGAAVTSPTDKSGPGTQAGKKAKEASGDAAQKKEGKPDSMDTPNDGNKKVAKPLAAGDQVEMEDDQEVIAEKEEVKEMDKMEMIKAMKDMETEMKDMPVEMVKATFDKMKEMMAKEMSHESTEEDKEKVLSRGREELEQRIKQRELDRMAELRASERRRTEHERMLNRLRKRSQTVWLMTKFTGKLFACCGKFANSLYRMGGHGRNHGPRRVQIKETTRRMVGLESYAMAQNPDV